MEFQNQSFFGSCNNLLLSVELEGFSPAFAWLLQNHRKVSRMNRAVLCGHLILPYMHSLLLEAGSLISTALSQGVPSLPETGLFPQTTASWSLHEAGAGSWLPGTLQTCQGLPSDSTALYMKLWDIMRSELFFFFSCSEIISGGKTPGWPRVVINFMCLGCSHHSEKRLRVGMIDDGQEGDGPWNCSTPSVPLIAGRSSEITSLHLPRINKPTIGFAELPSRRSFRTIASELLKLKQVFSDVSSEITCINFYFALKICLCVRGLVDAVVCCLGVPSELRHSLPILQPLPTLEWC